MQREGLNGKVLNLFPSWHTGIIHGDDGYDVTFREDSLVAGFSYAELSVGLRVSYGILFPTGVKVPVAIDMQPVRENQTESVGELAEAVTPRQVRSRVAF